MTTASGINWGLFLESFFANHWGVLLGGFFVIISILNAFTKHYSNFAGLKKFGLFLTEVFSFLASLDVRTLFKAPFVQISKPKDPPDAP